MKRTVVTISIERHRSNKAGPREINVVNIKELRAVQFRSQFSIIHQRSNQ